MDKLLKNIEPFYHTNSGSAYLGDSLVLMRSLPESSIDLILTSPPFALTRQKEYGNKQEEEYIEWFIEFSKEFYRILKKDGSLVIDLGGAYVPGIPVRSIYQFELLVHLCKKQKYYLAQEFFHYNPSRLPSPTEWVNVRRIRVKDSINVVWWLSKSYNPKADNRKILKPYSESMKALFKNGYKAKLRPSGHDISEKFNRDNGGAIPPNILELPNTNSNGQYQRKCRENEIKPHPARFPSGFSDFFIKFLTNEGDIVLDPFAGSNTTGFSAEYLNRKWISIELNEDYLKGSIFHFMNENLLFPTNLIVSEPLEKYLTINNEKK